MKSYSSRELKKYVESHGWVCVRINGDDHIFRHPDSVLTMMFPHPKKTMSTGVVAKTLKLVKGVCP